MAKLAKNSQKFLCATTSEPTHQHKHPPSHAPAPLPPNTKHLSARRVPRSYHRRPSEPKTRSLLNNVAPPSRSPANEARSNDPTGVCDAVGIAPAATAIPLRNATALNTTRNMRVQHRRAARLPKRQSPGAADGQVPPLDGSKDLSKTSCNKLLPGRAMQLPKSILEAAPRPLRCQRRLWSTALLACLSALLTGVAP